ncbi:DNA recombinase [Rhodococcus phage Finch]|uniref:RecA-like DNA recombinase n=1 Tax=Rhodococcus phage Finch TaxID=2094144 RepID=A0A2P1JXG3_9CAUD|nr:DNA recombinase [Rhodococcus phage Finch]AVO25013.1 RecA-like DNA recombinase [Rhodococcus phage Finch]
MTAKKTPVKKAAAKKAPAKKVASPSSSAEVAKLFADVNKKYGEGAIVKASEMPKTKFLPSGSLSLDAALGTGGVPENMVIEYCGPEGAGKTTFALLTACSFLDKYPKDICLILDVEHKLSTSWVETLVGPERIKRIVIMNPDTVEQATDMYRDAVTRGIIRVVIFDSIGGAPTSQVMDDDRSAEKGDSIGGNAKGVTKFARFAANFSHKYHTLTIGINQVRDDVKSMHGNMLNTPGGKGWKHACVARIHLRRGTEKYVEKLNGEDVIVGFDIVAKVIKNQMGGEEGRVAQWRFFTKMNGYSFGIGIDQTEECIRLSEKVGVVRRTGSYYNHPGLPGGKVQGKGELLDAVMADDALRATLVSETMAALADPSLLRLVAPLDPDGPATETELQTTGVGMGVLENRAANELNDDSIVHGHRLGDAVAAIEEGLEKQWAHEASAPSVPDGE